MPNQKLPQFPWLFYTTVNDEASSHRLYNLRERNFSELNLPELQGKLLKGSSHGWLVMLCVGRRNICLVNPFSGDQIQLPPRSTFPDVISYSEDRVNAEYCLFHPSGEFDLHSEHVNLYLTKKIVTSCIPSSENCIVVAIYEDGKLAWCTPTHKKWTPLDIYLITGIRFACIEDVIFSNNKLYVLNCRGRLFEVEDIGPNPKVKDVTSSIPSSEDCVAVAIYDMVGRLACCALTLKKWISLNLGSDTISLMQ